MRVSDRQREAASALLRRRFGDGYLSLDTLVERLDAVHSARDCTQLHGPPAALPPPTSPSRWTTCARERSSSNSLRGGAPAASSPYGWT